MKAICLLVLLFAVAWAGCTRVPTLSAAKAEAELERQLAKKREVMRLTIEDYGKKKFQATGEQTGVMYAELTKENRRDASATQSRLLAVAMVDFFDSKGSNMLHLTLFNEGVFGFGHYYFTLKAQGAWAQHMTHIK